MVTSTFINLSEVLHLAGSVVGCFSNTGLFRFRVNNLYYGTYNLICVHTGILTLEVCPIFNPNRLLSLWIGGPPSDSMSDRYIVTISPLHPSGSPVIVNTTLARITYDIDGIVHGNGTDTPYNGTITPANRAGSIAVAWW